MVTMLATGLIVMALVVDMIGAFIPGRLVLHSRTGLGRGALQDETCARYKVQAHGGAVLQFGAMWSLALSWCGYYCLQSCGCCFLQFRGSGGSASVQQRQPLEWVHRKPT